MSTRADAGHSSTQGHGGHDGGHGHDHGGHSHGDHHGGFSFVDEQPPELIRSRALAGLLRPIRGWIIVSTLLAFLSGLAALVPYIAVAELGRELLGGGAVDRDEVWRWVQIGVGAIVVRLLILLSAHWISHIGDAFFMRKTRSRIAQHVSRLPLGWLVTRGSAELKKAVEDDVQDMHHLVAHAFLDFGGGIAATVVALTYLFAVDWRMALVVIALLVVISWFIKLSYKAFPERAAEVAVAQRRINAATIEYVDGIEVVKAFGEEGQAYQRFADAINDFAFKIKAWFEDVSRNYTISMLLLSPATTMFAMLVAGAAFVGADSMRAADVLPFLLVAVGIGASYTQLGGAAQTYRRARMAATHVMDILDTPPLPEPAVPHRPKTYDVEFDNVRFSYGGSGDALTNVSFTAPPGTVTAIVGPSGSGKTTLTRLLPRFFDVDAGGVRIGGVDVRDMRSSEVLRLITMVFQDVVLLRDTVRENIRLGRPEATDAEVEAAARAARVHDVIARRDHGYDTVLGERGGFLSGGERQRVTIARAILQDAPIVILDEATAYADPENEAAVQDALAELTAGRTVFVIAHRLHTITHADKILVLDRGRIVERGTHEDLVGLGGLYARLWRAQEQAHAAAVDTTEVTK